MDAQTSELYQKLYSADIISDLRIIGEDKDSVLFAVKRSKYKTRIPRTFTPNIAYLAGVIAGDGLLCKTTRPIVRYPRVRIAIYNNSLNYLNNINDLFINEFGVGGKIYPQKDSNCFILYLFQRVVWLYFRNFFVLDKKALKVPTQFANEELFKFFLAGVFDTDGYCTKRAFRIMLGGASLHFLNELRDFSSVFYNLNFSKISTNILTVGDKKFTRISMGLSVNYFDDFVNKIPLRHERWKQKWASERTAVLNI